MHHRETNQLYTSSHPPPTTTTTNQPLKSPKNLPNFPFSKRKHTYTLLRDIYYLHWRDAIWLPSKGNPSLCKLLTAHKDFNFSSPSSITQLWNQPKKYIYHESIYLFSFLWRNWREKKKKKKEYFLHMKLT
jgi:hypothetical protein